MDLRDQKLPEKRSATGTVAVGASGVGSGAITIWVWNSILVPRTGLPEIPAEIAALIAPLLVAAAGWLWAWAPQPPKKDDVV